MSFEYLVEPKVLAVAGLSRLVNLCRVATMTQNSSKGHITCMFLVIFAQRPNNDTSVLNIAVILCV